VNGVLVAFGVSFGAIFVAEMGDKSQLMALTFATRFRPIPILVGIAIATAAVHAVSVLIGAILQVSLPTTLIEIAAGVLFIGFGIWTLRGDKLTDAERARVELTAERNAFVAELGDKTMLATITLATTYAPLGVWLGSTLGMLTADALASSSAGYSGRGSRSGRCGSGRPCCSSCSAPLCWSKGSGAE